MLVLPVGKKTNLLPGDRAPRAGLGARLAPAVLQRRQAIYHTWARSLCMATLPVRVWPQETLSLGGEGNITPRMRIRVFALTTTSPSSLDFIEDLRPKAIPSAGLRMSMSRGKVFRIPGFSSNDKVDDSIRGNRDAGPSCSWPSSRASGLTVYPNAPPFGVDAYCRGWSGPQSRRLSSHSRLPGERKLTKEQSRGTVDVQEQSSACMLDVDSLSNSTGNLGLRRPAK